MTIKQQGGVFGRNPSFNNVYVNGLSINGTDVTSAITGLGTISTQDANSVNIDGGSIDGTAIGANSASTGAFSSISAYSSSQADDLVLARFASEAAGSGETNTLIKIEKGNNYGGVFGGYLAQGVGSGAVIGAINGGSITEVAKFNNAGNMSIINGNLVIGTSGKGIDFSATSGTGTSELLDDYEEGTWTPLFTDGTNSATMSAFNAGFYTKVGNLVTLSGYIESSSLGSMSGSVKLAGLPFTTAGTGGAHTGSAAGWGNNLNITAGQVVGMMTDLGTTTIGLKLWDASTGATDLQASEMLSNTVISINITYRAA